jgi:hypothetical protein
VRRVFGFLRAFAERRTPNVRVIGQVGRKLRLRDMPEHPCIRIGSVSLRGPNARGEEDEGSHAEPLLRIRRPNLTKAPPRPTASPTGC